jgi:hypothetical protein
MRIDVFSATSASQRSRVIVSHEKNTQSSENDSKIASRFKNALPFEPLTFTFQDVQYIIETPQVKTKEYARSVQVFLNPFKQDREL